MGITLKTRLANLLSQLSAEENRSSIVGIRRGVEREALRINPDGKLSQKGHPKSLGATLTHPLITTDYAESLLEFITPAETAIETTLNQLQDIHKFVQHNIGDERLWSLSMPCYINDEDDIQIAHFGESNIGKMKQLYRVGLKHRYGSMMQVISGVHFNFSFPKSFWQTLAKLENRDVSNESLLQDFISARYFGLIRNFKRYVWLMTYLFGASPALCSSFLKNAPSNMPFEKFPNGGVYLPNSTSLRMSDLGYTNQEQAALKIRYNDLDDYVAALRKAIRTPSEKYQSIGVKEGNDYRQLNDNILQIENEFYSPVRPKRTTFSGEKPTDALASRGVEYVEIRALDVNPFVATGISQQQIEFLDVFLTYCALLDSPEMGCDAQIETESNLNIVIVDGRKSGLTLQENGESRCAIQWAREVFAELTAVASYLDSAFGTTRYTDVIALEQKCLDDPDLTLSGQLLKVMFATQHDESSWALQQADAYKQSLLTSDYKVFDTEQLTAMSTASHNDIADIEKQDTQSFDDFLHEYFDYASVSAES